MSGSVAIDPMARAAARVPADATLLAVWRPFAEEPDTVRFLYAMSIVRVGGAGTWADVAESARDAAGDREVGWEVGRWARMVGRGHGAAWRLTVIPPFAAPVPEVAQLLAVARNPWRNEAQRWLALRGWPQSGGADASRSVGAARGVVGPPGSGAIEGPHAALDAWVAWFRVRAAFPERG